MRDPLALHQELSQAGIPLGNYSPEDHVLAEADYALSPRQHEGVPITYGFISVPSSLTLSGCLVVPPEEMTLSTARSLADGASIFVLIQAGRYAGGVMLSHPCASELELVSLQVATQGVIATSDPRGVTRFYFDTAIAICEHRHWRFKRPVSAVAGVVARRILQRESVVLGRILEFCLHVLSPEKIGATLVWCLEEPCVELLEACVSQVHLRPLRLDFTQEAVFAPLRSILERNDGAALVAPDGRVLGAGAHLVLSTKSQQVVAAESGTRHTSARRFSYDWAETVVFAVSADGPVSVFSDGAKITEIVEVDLESATRHFQELGERPDAAHSSWLERCPRCGKTSRVEAISTPGRREHENAACEVCGTTLAERSGHMLRAHIVKVARSSPFPASLGPAAR
jgi:DNA integrity scanning protein DisA with diadenylate cyclase activity